MIGSLRLRLGLGPVPRLGAGLGRLALLLGASSLIAAQPVRVQAQEPLRDNRTSAEVEVQKVTTLQFQNLDVAPNTETQGFRLPDGGWGATSRIFGGIVPLFSPTGAPTGTLGHPGPGPGEFKTPLSAMAVGKQLWVVDPGNNRLTAFASDGKMIGDRTLPGRVFWVQPTTEGRGLLLSGFFGTSSGVYHTVARLTMDKADDRFGGDVGTSHYAWVQQHVAAETPSGEIWAVARSGGDIQILSADSLEPLAATHLPEDLSQPERRGPIDISKERPGPEVYGVTVGPDGILWMVMFVADAHWRSGLDRRTASVDEFWDTLVLAVSARDRAIVGARRMDQLCLPVLSPGDALISCTNEGAATIDISRLSLAR
jgi:hypothetical protein